MPSKPIRYVVNTHHHFDHSGGLRTYVDQGTTVVTHAGNRDFYEQVFFYPAARTLELDLLSARRYCPIAFCFQRAHGRRYP